MFALLYPEAPDLSPAAEADALEALAAEWGGAPPLERADRLALYEVAADESGRRGRRRVLAFSQALARAVERPEDWLDALLARGFYDRAAPFLLEDVARRREGWERRLLSALALDPLAETAAALALRLDAPPAELLERALEEVAETPLLAETLAREGLPLMSLRALLRSPRWQTALAAALGAWAAAGEVRPELADAWRSAVLRAQTLEYDETAETQSLQYGLRLLLARDPDLALGWLAARLSDPTPPVYFGADSAFARALDILDRPRRERLLAALTALPLLQSLLPYLVRGDVLLFRQLLALPHLIAYHLAPLRRAPEAAWAELAAAALDAGHAPREVAEASLFRPIAREDHEDRWRQRDRAFAALAASPREDLREVGRLGRQRIEEEVRRERERSAIPRKGPEPVR